MHLPQRIARWMDLERQSWATTAASLGLPGSFEARLPSMESVAPQTWSDSPASVQLSVVHDFAKRRAIEKARPTDLTGDAAPIAVELERQIGTTMLEYSPYEQPGQLAWVRLETDGDPILASPTFDHDHPYNVTHSLRASQRLLLKALTAYLGELPSLDSGDTVLAERIASELLAFATSQDVCAVTLVPIGGIRLYSERIEVGDIVMRRMTPLEMGEVHGPADELAVTRIRPPLTPWSPGARFAVIDHVLEVRRYQLKRERLSSNDEVHRILLALQLLGCRVFAPPLALTRSEPYWLFLSSPQLSTFLPTDARVGDEPTGVDEAKLREAVELAHKMPDLYDDADPRAFLLSRYASAASRSTPRDMLVDSVICLEGLFLAKVESELSFRFSIYGAHFMAGGSSDREETFKQLKDIYGMRSRVVHGSRLSVTDLTPVAFRALSLAQRALVKAIRDGWPTPTSLQSAALGLG